MPEAQLERKLMLAEVTPLGEALRAQAREVLVRLDAERLLVGEPRRRRLEALRSALRSCPGRCRVSVVVRLADGSEATIALAGVAVDPTEELMARVEVVFGEKVLELRS